VLLTSNGNRRNIRALPETTGSNFSTNGLKLAIYSVNSVNTLSSTITCNIMQTMRLPLSWYDYGKRVFVLVHAVARPQPEECIH